ncbi:MAG: diguanylate cyclase [Deltaproteobacteria bacterium]|nr:diguanylate cyclase [Deltaproteobacteria bacterium]
MRQFPGYTTTGQIGQTLHSTVYRASKEGRGATVIIKALRAEYPSPAEVARLKHECELVRGIKIDGTVKILDVIDHDGGIALVMEDFEGIPLKEIIGDGLRIDRFLEVAIRLAEILGNLHQGGISHRDIKPSNILINRERDIVKITDFGIATEMTRRNDEIYHPEVMAGTLPYMSPEQTGRMSCAVDYRTDLYSLGITFYEMLTGEVPFTSREPLEIIHFHIAKVPPPPERVRADIPSPLSGIVMKLLAKSAEDRYQSGFALAADLRECLDQLRRTGRVEAFDLGRNDVSPWFHIPHFLVGRDAELKELHDVFDRASRGSAEVMLVSGEPGIGKTALVNEVHNPIADRRGYFIAGSHDQFRKNVPYSGMIQAFQSLARQILAESEERVLAWKEKLRAALGPNGKIITDAIPELEIIMGRQPDVVDLGPEESLNRLTLVFKNFIRVFAEREHPLVLFLDDLQWADSASLNLLQTIAADRGLRFFLLIGACRDNEVTAHHPLMLAVDAMRTAGMTVNTITLGTLSSGGVNQLISHLFRCAPDLSRPLAEVIHGKTNGNPFFLNQFLQTLPVEGHISFDPGRGWTWDMEAIQELQVTDNVLQFMAGRLKTLPADALELIRVCACIGNRFDLETLASLTALSIDAILYALDPLIREGFIYHTGDLYRFYHDRIREAAYSLLELEERERIHFEIGALELQSTPSEELFNRIFYITDQLNRGSRLITAEEERTRLAELNLKAGLKAKDAAAYHAAVEYLAAGAALLAEGSWRTKYDLTYALHERLMESHYLDRNFEEAERIFRIIILNAATKRDKARVYNRMVVLYTNMRSPQDAIRLGLEALRALFGIRITPDVGAGRVLLNLVRVKLGLRRLSLEKIIDIPRMEDDDLIACHELMLSIGTPAYYVNQNLFALLTLRGVNAFLKFGHTPHSATTFIALATILATVLGDYELGYRIGEMTLKLNEKLDNRNVAGMVHHTFAFFIQHWRRHARDDLDFYRKAYQFSLNAGNFIYAGHSVNAAADTRLVIGDRLDDILDDIKKYDDLMKVVKDHFIATRRAENIQFILNLKGLTEDRFSLSGGEYDEASHIERLRREKNLFGLCYALLYKVKLLYLYGRYDEARETAEELDRHIKVPVGTLLVPEHYFYYSLILAALLREENRSNRDYRKIIRRNQRKMARWARLCPENFRHKHDLVEAETAGIEGRFHEAARRYHAAIESAHEHGYIQNEAISCERAALFYRAEGYGEIARGYMTAAHHGYRQWGATAKMNDLEERYPSLMPKELPRRPSDSSGEGSSTESPSRLLDLTTVMQVSQAISGEIMLDRLLQKIMHLSLVNAGAQRGFLILESDGRLTIEAAEEGGDGDIRVMQSVPLETCDDLSTAVVHYTHRSGEHVILGDAAEEGTFVNDPYIMRNRCKSILCTPIMHQGKTTGILYMENNLTANAFTPERLEILGIISAQAAISLANAKLFDLATTDGLTKLFVHRYFHLLLDQEIQRSRRHSQPFSLVMADIDDFKDVNDAYGHQFGDEVLRSVAETMKRSARAVDIVARYGGEEFVLILPETDLEGALVAAEKIRTAVEKEDIFHKEERLHVTISLGIAAFPRHADEKDLLIRAADEAMYDAKRAGKNRVAVYQRKMTR